jgi:hypothetical protein
MYWSSKVGGIHEGISRDWSTVCCWTWKSWTRRTVAISERIVGKERRRAAIW